MAGREDGGGRVPGSDDGVPAEMRESWLEWNATRLQAAYRGHHVRAHVVPGSRDAFVQREAQRAERAATVIQRAYRGAVLRRGAPSMTREVAATRIARWYRGRLCRKMYHVLRGMMVGREAEEPGEMLRTSIPLEVQVAGDAAAGAHVRLRLGGSEWPPRIYFKVFTHRPVIDLGGYAPRDYTREVGRGSHDVRTVAPATKHLHSTYRRGSVPERDSDAEGRPGWYVREDRNGWRPLGGGLDMLYAGPSTRMDYTVPVPKARLGEAARRRKQRKVEWMKKIYASGKVEGLLDAHEDPWDRTGVSALREEVLASLGGLATDEDLMEAIRLNSEGSEHPDDEHDVESMTRWARLLDFDSYMADWSAQATSAGFDYVYSQAGEEGVAPSREWAGLSDPISFTTGSAFGLSVGTTS